LLKATLHKLGLLPSSSAGVATIAPADEVKINFNDAFREVVNVAMGRAAALLARVLGVFVQLPVPTVNVFEVGELHMALSIDQRHVSAAALPARRCWSFMTRKSAIWPS
jgi:hypothetical protein